MAIILKYRAHIVHLIKVNVLMYTSYKDHCELYTKIYESVAVNSCLIELFQKEAIVLRDNILVKYS